MAIDGRVLLTREKGARKWLSFTTEFRATGFVCKTGVYDFRMVREVRGGHPDFVGTARKRMKTFPRGAKDD